MSVFGSWTASALGTGHGVEVELVVAWRVELRGSRGPVLHQTPHETNQNVQERRQSPRGVLGSLSGGQEEGGTADGRVTIRGGRDESDDEGV